MSNVKYMKNASILKDMKLSYKLVYRKNNFDEDKQSGKRKNENISDI